MKLSQLLDNIICERIAGDTDIAVTGVQSDSRQVRPANVFVAVSGPALDGHRFIPRAIEAGATAVVCEHIPADAASDVVWVQVPDAAEALGYLASEWYGNPSRKLTLVGVTGTNGKTTVATLLYEAARMAGHEAGLLSTVENRVADERFATTNTTPSPLEINRLLAMMVEKGCTFAAMECSSHGQVQKRTAGLHFAGAVFTNLTRDHLDYHKTFDAYLAAKKSLFDDLPDTAWALVNADDPHGTVMLQNTRAARHTYSMRADADFRGRDIENRIDGTLMSVNGTEVETHFAGKFNCYNLLAVYGALCLTGETPDEAALTLSRLVPVAGRFQWFRSDDGVTVVVDYAHTPDALANVLDTIRAVRSRGAAVVTVTGAGGNRDHGKRPQMGREAALRSDRLIITSDNPRDEDPADIAEDIKGGVPVDRDVQTDIILDRAAAIHAAVMEANAGDIILVAGKGHEDYQEFAAHRRIHFDDREQTRSAIAARNTELAEQAGDR